MENMKRRITIKDVADRAGVCYSTTQNILSSRPGYAKATVEKVAKAAQELNYTSNRHSPANNLFASRANETGTMQKLRNEGFSNEEIAHRCGVTVTTVIKRIGVQPQFITDAHKKLAGKMMTAKREIRYAYMQQHQTVVHYNKMTEELNNKLVEAVKMAEKLASMRENATAAAKSTNTTLVQLIVPSVFH